MTDPYYSDESVTLHHGDCLDVLRALPDASVDAVVTDPPYGLEFMGKDWDGADGFRRSLNPNDAGRDNAFGRTSRTSPEYRTTSKAKAGMTGTGYTDGAERLERPSHMGGLNPKCRNCDKWQRGGNPCRCDAPDFPDERLPRLHTFQQWCELWATECLRVLKPGGHLLAFGGTRTWHRLACAVEDAGFEVRDSIAWLYGSGFPKSLDVSKAIDKGGHLREERGREFQAWLRQHLTPQQVNAATGTDMGHHLTTHPTQPAVATADLFDRLRPLLPTVPERIERLVAERTGLTWEDYRNRAITGKHLASVVTGDAGMTVRGEGKERRDNPATPDAERWQGWGTALKPAFEPVVVARKPLAGTVAANVLQHGTGALNIDGCRVEGEPWKAHSATGLGKVKFFTEGETPVIDKEPHAAGRWPTNVLLDDSQAAELDRQSGERTSGVLAAHHTRNPKESGILGAYGSAEGERGYGDTGGASRFFPTFRYEAKAPTSERPRVNGTAHPTVKPLDLMRWLVRLVTPPGGTVLEPFAGSGTTVEACIVEGFHCIAIEREADYLPLIMQRVHRRRDPIEAVRQVGGDLGLFDLDTGETA